MTDLVNFSEKCLCHASSNLIQFECNRITNGVCGETPARQISECQRYKMCVSPAGRRGDHTSADSYLTVVPRGTEFVVFSIDGSFAASVSIMGSDPKVRAGAVDVVR